MPAHTDVTCMQPRAVADEGFGVGHTRSTQTKGVWVWGEPQRVATGGAPVIVYVDTEGFESTGKSDVYDDRIFALSAIMSALLVRARGGPAQHEEGVWRGMLLVRREFAACQPFVLLDGAAHCPRGHFEKSACSHGGEHRQVASAGCLLWLRRCTTCPRRCARAMWRS